MAADKAGHASFLQFNLHICARCKQFTESQRTLYWTKLTALATRGLSGLQFAPQDAARQRPRPRLRSTQYRVRVRACVYVYVCVAIITRHLSHILKSLPGLTSLQFQKIIHSPSPFISLSLPFLSFHASAFYIAARTISRCLAVLAMFNAFRLSSPI